jgi:hypothetical protein
MELGDGQVLQRSLVVAVNSTARTITERTMRDRLGGGEMEDDLWLSLIQTPGLQTQVGLMGQ